MESADPEWARLLRHLSSSGPSLLEDLQRELELEPSALKALRAPLERCGAVLARPVVIPPHRHTSELARWDHFFASATSDVADLAGLVVAGVRAAVVVRENEPRKWFSWTWRWDGELVDGSSPQAASRSLRRAGYRRRDAQERVRIAARLRELTRSQKAGDDLAFRGAGDTRCRVLRRDENEARRDHGRPGEAESRRFHARTRRRQALRRPFSAPPSRRRARIARGSSGVRLVSSIESARTSAAGEDRQAAHLAGLLSREPRC